MFKTSITRTIIAINRPNKVQMNTPPKDLRVIPSESSRIGQSLRFVLFQYLPAMNHLNSMVPFTNVTYNFIYVNRSRVTLHE